MQRDGRRRRLGRMAAAAVVAAGTATAGLAAPGAAAPSVGQIWSVPVDRVGVDDANVAIAGGLTVRDRGLATVGAVGAGYLLSAAHDFATPTNRITAQVSADVPAGAEVTVDVRARTAAGWTEWAATPATLAQPATEVQARVGLTGGARVRAVTVRGEQVDTAVEPQLATLAGPYTIYATREGLVGGTTANGHVITSRDHFVALPSSRGLAAKNTGTYTVKVCANSRCEWAPVWDIGPWNTKDDYWNPSSTREMWKDLPQGKPEAQAAYQSGYNGGKDQFGRTVLNPAGIDLADGVFWDGLLLSNNGWVTVTYLWTGSGIIGKVSTAGSPMNVRSGPHTTSTVVGLAANYAQVTIECQTQGDSVSGTFGVSTLWDRISTGSYVSDAYVNTGSDGQVAPNC